MHSKRTKVWRHLNFGDLLTKPDHSDCFCINTGFWKSLAPLTTSNPFDPQYCAASGPFYAYVNGPSLQISLPSCRLCRWATTSPQPRSSSWEAVLLQIIHVLQIHVAIQIHMMCKIGRALHSSHTLGRMVQKETKQPWRSSSARIRCVWIQRFVRITPKAFSWKFQRESLYDI